MMRMMEAYKCLAPEKDLESFRIGYSCRQEHIDVLQEENMDLQKQNTALQLEKKNYLRKKNLVDSLERLFNALIKHEHSECGICLYCDNQWKIIALIREKLEEMK